MELDSAFPPFLSVSSLPYTFILARGTGVIFCFSFLLLHYGVLSCF